MLHTKIGATIGPSSNTQDIITKMVEAGMHFARLNFAHGTPESNGELIAMVREAEQKTGKPIAILADLQGPRIRIGDLPDKGVVVADGDSVVFTGTGDNDSIPLDYPSLPRFVKSGETILIDDGRIELKVEEASNKKILAKVVHGGTIRAHKGINLPDTALHIPALSEKDQADVGFALEKGVDMIGLSFVSSAKDVLDLRYLIKLRAQEMKIALEHPIAIIAKIERHEAVENLTEILDAADGIMVARGDLGLELPAEEVPLIQKRIIDAANAKAKPVIVATQLLDSMRENIRPTRAEVSDVANAVIDHADALLLTNETAAGKYPLETVKTMADIIATTEKSPYDDMALPTILKKGAKTEEAIADLSRILADEVKAKVILAASITGETGRIISHVRPSLPILVATNSEIVWRQLNISWGVQPFVMQPCNSLEELVERSVMYIKQHKFAKPGDKMIIIAGEPVGQAGNVNLVEVREIK